MGAAVQQKERNQKKDHYKYNNHSFKNLSSLKAKLRLKEMNGKRNFMRFSTSLLNFKKRPKNKYRN
jgi:hypothetical protein